VQHRSDNVNSNEVLQLKSQAQDLMKSLKETSQEHQEMRKSIDILQQGREQAQDMLLQGVKETQ